MSHPADHVGLARLALGDEGDPALAVAQRHVDVLAREQDRALRRIGGDAGVADLEPAQAGGDQADDLDVRGDRRRVAGGRLAPTASFCVPR